MNSNFTPDFEQLSAFPDKAASIAAVKARDWAGVRAVYDRATGWVARGRAMAGTSVTGSEDFLSDVVARYPDDLVAATMLGTRLVYAGWEIRGGGRASSVSEAQFEAFHNHLRRAEQILISVCARDPAFVPAWEERITIARALSLGQSEARRRYDNLIRQEPHHLGAQNSLLQQLCPKWGGDFAAMHAFAAECTAAAPPGYPNAALVVDGHMEHWLDFDSTAEGDAYMTSAAVRSEIQAAADRSVMHPAFDRSRDWVYAMSMFALGFTMIGDWPRAKWCFNALGPYADKWGWQYLPGGAEQEFVQRRAAAMERG